jgi:putative tricarboxylic transport membrane protein
VRAYETLFAGLVLVAGIVYEVMAWRMPRGKIGYPGPGFFPVIVGAILVLTAVACLFQALLIGRSDGASTEGRNHEAPALGKRLTTRIWLLVGFLMLYAVTVQPVGFPIALTVFLVAAIRVFGYRKWLPALGIAAALTIISYLTFVVWLKVPLPLGILTDILD